MHRAAKGRADQHPEQAGEIAELRGEHRADKRARSRDGGEVVPENDPLVRRDEFFSVFVDLGGRSPEFVEREHLRHQPGRMETIATSVASTSRTSMCAFGRSIGIPPLFTSHLSH